MIFGITGDLARKMTFQALYLLERRGLVSCRIVGVAMDARLSLYVGFGDPLALLRSLAQMAIGVPYFLVRALGYGMGPVTSVTHEYGNTFTEVAFAFRVTPHIVLTAVEVAVVLGILGGAVPAWRSYSPASRYRVASTLPRHELEPRSRLRFVSPSIQPA